MMLPEHREILVERRKPEAKGQEEVLPSADWRLVRQAVILPAALSVLRGNIKRLQVFHSPLHKLYVQATLVLIDCLIRDEAEVKQELAAKGIRLLEQASEGDMLHCRCMYRGVENSFDFTRDALRQEVAKQLRHSIAALFSSGNTR